MEEVKFTYRLDDATELIVLQKDGVVMGVLKAIELMPLGKVLRDAMFDWVEHFKKKLPQEDAGKKNIIGG